MPNVFSTYVNDAQLMFTSSILGTLHSSVTRFCKTTSTYICTHKSFSACHNPYIIRLSNKYVYVGMYICKYHAYEIACEYLSKTDQQIYMSSYPSNSLNATHVISKIYLLCDN